MDAEDIEVYDGKTWTFQHQEIQQLFAGNPWLLQAFGEEWCRRELLFPDRRRQEIVHPLFFRFGPLGRGAHLIESLRIFKESQPATRFGSFLGKLRADRSNVDAHINNLIAYCYLHRRGACPQWEPPMPDGHESDKRPDIGIPHAKGLIYTEVMTIAESEADRRHSDAILGLRKRVNAIPNIVHDVSVSFGLGFQLGDIEDIFSFIEEQIRSGRLPKEEDAEGMELEFEKNRRPIVSIRFYKTDGRRGAWMGSGGPTMHRSDSRRAKGKILEKLKEDCYQLPPRPALGGYMICLDDYYMRPDDVVDAIVGSQGFVFSTVEGQSRSVRLQDGIIHHKGGVKIADVDFVVVVDRTLEEWNAQHMRVIMNEHPLIPRMEIEQIFLASVLPVQALPARAG